MVWRLVRWQPDYPPIRQLVKGLVRSKRAKKRLVVMAARHLAIDLTYTHSVTETQVNVHTAGDVEIDTPAVVHAFKPLWVHAKFQKKDGGYFKGTDLYAFTLFQAPEGLFFVEPLTDDGLGFDPAANDSIYAGSLNLEGARRVLLHQNQDVFGVWRVFVFAQDVNLSKSGTPPEIAAQHIGGFFVASAIEITFDPTLPCPLKAQAATTVV
jgi:hypothetical protein